MSDAPNPPSGSEVTIDGVTWRFTPGGMLEPNQWRSQSGNVAHYAHHVALNRVRKLEEEHRDLRALLGPTASLTVREVIQLAAKSIQKPKEESGDRTIDMGKSRAGDSTWTPRERVWYVTDCTGLPASAEWDTWDQAQQSALKLNALYPNYAPHLVSFRYL